MSMKDDVSPCVESPEHEWPRDGLEEVGRCPVCGSAIRTKLHDRLTDKVFFCAPGEWTLYRCGGCLSAYLNPRPTKDTIGIAYSNYFTHSKDDDIALSGFRRIRRMLANGYRNKKYRTSDQPTSIFGYWLALILPKQRAVMDAVMRNLPPANQGARLLDIGCGNGDFLVRAKNAGWSVMGVDADQQAVELARARGLDVLHGSVDAISHMEESFDGITLSHVIEHVHDPVALLMHCYNLLKPGGWLWVDTPNMNSQGYKKYGRNWFHLDPPRHLVLFTSSSLKDCLRISGFSSIQDESWRPIYLAASKVSENIEQRKSPFSGVPSLLLMLESWFKEKRAKKYPEHREFVCIRAKKPDLLSS